MKNYREVTWREPKPDRETVSRTIREYFGVDGFETSSRRSGEGSEATYRVGPQESVPTYPGELGGVTPPSLPGRARELRVLYTPEEVRIITVESDPFTEAVADGLGNLLSRFYGEKPPEG
mgnify:FL=1